MLVCQRFVQPPARGTELISPAAATAAATTQACVPAAQTAEGTAHKAASAAATAAAPHAHARNVRGHDPTHAHAPTTAAPDPARRSTAAHRPPALSFTRHWGGSRKGPRGVRNDPWPRPHPQLVTWRRRDGGMERLTRTLLFLPVHPCLSPHLLPHPKWRPRVLSAATRETTGSECRLGRLSVGWSVRQQPATLTARLYLTTKSSPRSAALLFPLPPSPSRLSPSLRTVHCSS